mmetsp:Transcript_14591/g.36298  ORF Transcript_14591/g.36298 Transcript_14591/m.36298 type:complete len:254 (-) Transcript_14591:434-1195(-)
MRASYMLRRVMLVRRVQQARAAHMSVTRVPATWGLYDSWVSWGPKAVMTAASPWTLTRSTLVKLGSAAASTCTCRCADSSSCTLSSRMCVRCGQDCRPCHSPRPCTRMKRSSSKRRLGMQAPSRWPQEAVGMGSSLPSFMISSRCTAGQPLMGAMCSFPCALNASDPALACTTPVAVLLACTGAATACCCPCSKACSSSRSRVCPWGLPQLWKSMRRLSGPVLRLAARCSQAWCCSSAPSSAPGFGQRVISGM